MNTRKYSIFLLIFFFCFVLPPFLSAEENEVMQISFYTMVYSVTTNHDIEEVTFLTHTPIITENSVPVLIELPQEGNYNSNVHDFEFKYLKEDKHLIRFILRNNMGTVKNYIAFQVYTLQRVCDYQDMPTTVHFSAYADLKEDLRYYLQPSSSIQSDNKKIKTKAYSLLYENWVGYDVIHILKRIIYFTAKTVKSSSGNQTALNTLSSLGGVCTGKANLAAGLCRVLGIPARILFVLPTHYIVEIALPGYGWVGGESSFNEFPYATNSYTVQWVADIEDENFGGRKGGVIAYWDFDGQKPDASWDIEYDDIYSPGRYNENFATIEVEAEIKIPLWEKAQDLWRIFSQVKNSGLNKTELVIFSGYHRLYFENLVRGNVSESIQYADLAMAEAKRLLNLKTLGQK